MAFTAIVLVAETADDLPALHQTLDRYAQGHTVATSGTITEAAHVKPALTRVAVPNNNVPDDGAVRRPEIVSGWKSLYAHVALAAGLPTLTDAQRTIVKDHLPKDRTAVPMATIVAALRSAPVAPPVAQVAPVAPIPQADPNEAKRQALMAQLAALDSPQPAQVAPVAPVANGLQAMPHTCHALAPHQVTALRTWAADTLAARNRKEAVLAYCDGEFTWPQVEAQGVKSKSALRQVNG